MAAGASARAALWAAGGQLQCFCRVLSAFWVAGIIRIASQIREKRIKYAQKDTKCTANHLQTLTLRGQSPVAGAGEIRKNSVDTAYTIADYRGSGEGRDDGIHGCYEGNRRLSGGDGEGERGLRILRGQSPHV